MSILFVLVGVVDVDCICLWQYIICIVVGGWWMSVAVMSTIAIVLFICVCGTRAPD